MTDLIIGGIIGVVYFLIIFTISAIVMLLWNVLVPDYQITFWQAFAAFALLSIIRWVFK